MEKAVKAVLIAISIASTSQAGIFVSTGHAGAQVQCDFQHTQHWTYSVSQDIGDITGARLTMKNGSQTSASINFVIFEGEYSSFGIATNMLSTTLNPDAFTQQFNPIMFEADPITLIAGRTYTAVLSSTALDPQNEAYFIKGGSETPLVLVDVTGDPWDGGGSIVPPYVPAPGAISLLGLAGFMTSRRRISH